MVLDACVIQASLGCMWGLCLSMGGAWSVHGGSVRVSTSVSVSDPLRLVCVMDRVKQPISDIHTVTFLLQSTLVALYSIRYRALLTGV